MLRPTLSNFMKIPDNMTEQEVLETIDKVASRLAYKFTFGYYGYDDIKQEAVIIAMDGLKTYKPNLPLENFLWVHMRNRLVNFKRDHFIRRDKPCSNCPLKAYVKKTDSCKIYEDKMECELYSNWKTRNENKKNIITPISMEVVVDENEKNTHCDSLVDAFDNKELISRIDREMPIYMRHIWLQAKAGAKISAEDMRQLREIVGEMFPEEIEGDENE